MILDTQNLFSDAQAITGTAASTNYLSPISGRNLGAKDIPLLIQVTEAFNTLTSLTIAIQTDDNTSFSSATTVYSIVVPLASLVAGYIVPLNYMPDTLIAEKYVRVLYTVTGSNPTTGKITAGFVAAREKANLYADYRA